MCMAIVTLCQPWAVANRPPIHYAFGRARPQLGGDGTGEARAPPFHGYAVLVVGQALEKVRGRRVGGGETPPFHGYAVFEVGW